MKRILGSVGLAVGAAAATLTLVAAPAFAEGGQSCVHVWSLPGFIFANEYAEGAIREE